jgi:Ankyrin repeats (3 copies)
MSAEGFNYREPWGVSSHAIIRELLKHNANLNARSKSGATPLIVAAGHFGPDDASFLLELVDSGADVNAADEDGQTALRAAAERGHVTKVRFLLEHRAKADAKDKVGRTALQYARRPRNDRDDEFPQCYDSLNGDGSMRMNDCAETRRTLQRALDSIRRSSR